MPYNNSTYNLCWNLDRAKLGNACAITRPRAAALTIVRVAVRAPKSIVRVKKFLIIKNN